MLFYFTVTSSRDHKIVLTLDCENGTVEMCANAATIKYKDGTVENSNSAKDEYSMLGKECYGTGHYKQIAEFYSADSDEKVKATMLQAYKTQKLLEELYNVAGIDRN